MFRVKVYYLHYYYYYYIIVIIIIIIIIIIVYLFIFILFFLGIRKCANTTLTIPAGRSQLDISRSLSGDRPRRSDWDGVVKKKTALRAIT